MISNIKVDIKKIESSRVASIKGGIKKRIVVSDDTVVGNSAKPSLVREDKIFVSYQSEMQLYGHTYHHGDGCVYFPHHLAFGKMNDLPVPIDLPGRNNSFF